MTVNEFRKYVKTGFPHVKVSVKTVSFMDLARDSAKCLTITGDRSSEERKAINTAAKEAGILPDSNIRFYQFSK